MHFNLLSRTKTAFGKGYREKSGRMVSDYFEPLGSPLPKRIFQIYPFESTQGITERILLHHSGIAA